jgi:hypothetical protein
MLTRISGTMVQDRTLRAENSATAAACASGTTRKDGPYLMSGVALPSR